MGGKPGSGGTGFAAQCTYCEQLFTRKVDLKEHFMQCDKKPPREEKVFDMLRSPPHQTPTFPDATRHFPTNQKCRERREMSGNVGSGNVGKCREMSGV